MSSTRRNGRCRSHRSVVIAVGCVAILAVTVDLRGADAPRTSEAVQKTLGLVSQDRLRADVLALVAVGTRHVFSPVDDPTRGVGAARRYLKQELERAAERSEGRMTVHEVSFERPVGRRDPRPGTFVNYIAHQKGKDPTRGAWVFGGHYDSRNSRALDGDGDAPGADDDASGTAVILELARLLAPIELSADVYLCAFDGEELGLFGSDQFAESLKERGIAVEGMITNDIVGASVGPDGVKRDYLRCFSEGFSPDREVDRRFRNYSAETEGESRQLARYAALLGSRYVSDLGVRLIYRQDRFGRGGDHRSFNRRGYPGVRFTEAVENYHHQHQNVREEDGIQYGDLPRFMDFDYLTRVCRLNLAVALNGAGAPPPPAWLRLRGPMRHDTTLSWPAVESDAVVEYRVWRRPTDTSTWERFDPVPKQTLTLTLAHCSIDNWHFAISAVDSKGRESPVRFPYPAVPPRTPRAGR